MPSIRVSAGLADSGKVSRAGGEDFDLYLEVPCRRRSIFGTLVDSYKQPARNRRLIFFVGADRKCWRVGFGADASNQSAVIRARDGVCMQEVSEASRQSIGSERADGASFTAHRRVCGIRDLPSGGETQLGSATNVDTGIHPLFCARHFNFMSRSGS
jgi:hypothetical protein